MAAGGLPRYQPPGDCEGVMIAEETLEYRALETIFHDCKQQRDDLLAACERAEQTLRNLSNEWHDFDARQISMNEAANLRETIAKARGETSP